MRSVVIKDLDELYAKPIIVGDDGKFVCPVCGKVSAKLEAAENHLKEEACADYHNIYENTEQEIFGLKIFKYILAEVSPKSKPTFTVFKKSKSYNSVMRYVTFLNYKKMTHASDLYISWIVVRLNAKFMNQILKYAVDPKNLQDFKIDIHALNMVKNDQFIENNMDRFAEDPEFFVRSFELCRIGVMNLLTSTAFDGIVDALPAGYQERLYDFVDQVVAKKQVLRKKKEKSCIIY